MEGELGRTAKQTQAVAFGREGGVKSNPTVELTLGRGVQLRKVSNPTAPLTWGARGERCDLEPNGGVDFGERCEGG